MVLMQETGFAQLDMALLVVEILPLLVVQLAFLLAFHLVT